MRIGPIHPLVGSVILLNGANSTTINIPDDYPLIQLGIDAATDGDPVIVNNTIFENIADEIGGIYSHYSSPDPGTMDIYLSCDWGLGMAVSDMGAYGGGDTTQAEINDNSSSLPLVMASLRNYPNPFNSGTAIRFIIVEPAEVKITIYDLLGREVQTLIDEFRQAGVHTVIFDAAGLASGV